MTPIRYLTTNVPVSPWMIQGSTYQVLNDAKLAAARLYTALHIAGVAVKPVKEGFALFYWPKVK